MTPSCPFSPISFFLSLLLSFCTFWTRFGPHFGDLEVPTNSNLFEKVIKFEVFAVVTDSVLHVLCDIASWGGRRQGRSLQIYIHAYSIYYMMFVILVILTPSHLFSALLLDFRGAQERSWTDLGGSWELLESSWAFPGALGMSLGALRCSWGSGGSLGALGCSLGFLGCFRVNFNSSLKGCCRTRGLLEGGISM